MRPELTLADARDLDFETVIERSESLLSKFDPPDVETQHQKLDRISRTLEDMPEVYRWFLQLRSWCDHWTQAQADLFGVRDRRTQDIRQRRDLFEHMASAAKMRYEGASRQITVLVEFSPDGMPRGRRGD